MKSGSEIFPSRRNRIIMQLVMSLGFAFVVVNNATAKEVYTWVDEAGIAHYSDFPPDSVTTQTINIEGDYPSGAVDTDTPYPAPGNIDPGTTQLSAAEQRREDIAKNREERNKEKAETEKMCAKYQALLARVEPARRVLRTNDDGETVRLTDDERIAMVNDSKDYISKNCK